MAADLPALSALVNVLIGGLSFALADRLIDGHSHSRRLILIGGLIASCPATFVGIHVGRRAGAWPVSREGSRNAV